MKRLFKLAGLVLLTMYPGSTFAVDLPFSGELQVTTNFNAANFVRLADMDGDGDLDIAAMAIQANAVAWWSNEDGVGGAWSNHLVDVAFDDACGIFLGDVDGDGDVDILGAAPGTLANEISWWANEGGVGTGWTKRVIQSGFSGARGVFGADMDGDGKMDVLGAARTDDEVSWWRNNDGSGTNWTKTLIDNGFDSANSLYAADIDHDGDIDVVGSGDGSSDEIRWWENTLGDGSAWLSHNVVSNFDKAQDVIAADMDGDGDLDVAGVAGTDEKVSWFENLAGDGLAWLEHVVDPAFAGAFSVSCIDLDQDGDEDLLAVAEIDDDVSWWENLDGLGAFSIRRTLNTSFNGARSVTAGDVDGDGDQDVVACAFIDDDISWWRNDFVHRSARFCSRFETRSNVSQHIASVACDLDHDGDLDLVTAERDGPVTWQVNDGLTHFPWSQVEVDPAFSSGLKAFDVGDLDRDGDSDIVGVSSLGGLLLLWENEGVPSTQWVPRTLIPVTVGVQDLHLADLDRDGDLDTVFNGSNGDDLSWASSDGTGSNWMVSVIDAVVPQPGKVRDADLDGDGDPDLLGSSMQEGSLLWWENDDGVAGSFTRHAITSNDGAFTYAEGVDLDGDGDRDVLAARDGNNYVTWWENIEGATNWLEHVVSSRSNRAHTLHAGDWDADGDMDIASLAERTESFYWWENIDGTTTNWVEHTVPQGITSPVWSTAADLDNDGRTDMVFHEGGDNNPLTIWPERGGSFSLVATDNTQPIVLQGTSNLYLALTANHEGREGDGDLELVSFDLTLEHALGTPWDTLPANAFFDRFRVYVDEGSGTFEPGSDAIVSTIETLSLNEGRQTFGFPDGSVDAQLVLGTTRTYFVVAELNPTAGNQADTTLRLSHLSDRDNEKAGLGEYRDLDIPVLYECDPAEITVLQTVVTVTDISLDKTATPVVLETTNHVEYFLTVNNPGVNNAISVTITDNLPSGLTLDMGALPGNCTVEGSDVVCTLGTLLAGSSATVTIAVEVATNYVGALTNQAFASTLSQDDNLTDNLGIVTNTVPDFDMDGDPNFNDPDDDNDTIPDDWEEGEGLNPKNPVDATLDQDGDTFIAVQEYISDTDPFDSNDFNRVISIQENDCFFIGLPSSSARIYTLQSREGLTGEWVNVGNQVDFFGNDEVITLIDTNISLQRMFRVQTSVP